MEGGDAGVRISKEIQNATLNVVLQVILSSFQLGPLLLLAEECRGFSLIGRELP